MLNDRFKKHIMFNDYFRNKSSGKHIEESKGTDINKL